MVLPGYNDMNGAEKVLAPYFEVVALSMTRKEVAVR
jgi:hypothetical protein